MDPARVRRRQRERGRGGGQPGPGLLLVGRAHHAVHPAGRRGQQFVQQERAEEAGRAGQQDVCPAGGRRVHRAEVHLQVEVDQLAVAVRDRVDVRGPALRAGLDAAHDLGDTPDRRPAPAGPVDVHEHAQPALYLQCHLHRLQ